MCFLFFSRQVFKQHNHTAAFITLILDLEKTLLDLLVTP